MGMPPGRTLARSHAARTHHAVVRRRLRPRTRCPSPAAARPDRRRAGHGAGPLGGRGEGRRGRRGSGPRALAAPAGRGGGHRRRRALRPGRAGAAGGDRDGGRPPPPGHRRARSPPTSSCSSARATGPPTGANGCWPSTRWPPSGPSRASAAPVGDREVDVELRLVDALGYLVGERPRVLVVTRSGERVAGVLRSVGPGPRDHRARRRRQSGRLCAGRRRHRDRGGVRAAQPSTTSSSWRRRVSAGSG